jgi:hypothetical protein
LHSEFDFGFYYQFVAKFEFFFVIYEKSLNKSKSNYCSGGEDFETEKFSLLKMFAP